MVIVKFHGGIGNQLFQYAFYRELKFLGKEVKADLATFRNENEIRSYELAKVGLDVDVISERELIRLNLCRNGKLNNLRYYCFGKKREIRDEYGQVFNPCFFEYENAYLNGYWQTKKYFPDVFELVKEEVDFGGAMDERTNRMALKMKTENAVSIHMRFGDYVGNALYSGICNAQYYQRAVNLLKEKEESLVFYVLSDDARRAKEVLQGEEFIFWDNNQGEDSYKDLYLISKCRHHIMANSSFSWWGVMLGNNKEGVTIAPATWLNGVDTRDVWEKEWIKI